MPIVEHTRHYHQQQSFVDPFNDPAIEDQYPPDLDLEPVHLEIALYLDLENQVVEGRVTTTVKARRNGPTDLRLDAIDFENIAVHDPDGQPVTWRYDDRKLTIQWGAPFAAAEERRVEIAYQVVKPVAGLYFSKPNDAYPEQRWYVTSDHETERARHWLPCLDLPNVRTTLDFHLRAASRFTILANGSLVEETDHGDGTKTAHWRLVQRCPSYLICIAIGEFVRADDGSFNDGEKEIPLAYFCSQDHTAQDLQRAFGRTGAMMAWLTKKFALPFPYPKYYQFALPSLGGAMENISLVSWNDRFVLDETLAQEWTRFVDEVNLHEMAHSYFGDAIVCRDFAHAWLKESWATYIPQCWREDDYTADEALYIYHQNATAYFREADETYQRPIVTRRFKSSWDLYDRHLYQGGACRLHTLRCELGDDVFWPAVQDYLKRYQEKVVETDDFRHVLEEHSGRALGRFFDQWFHTPGYPALNVAFEFDSVEKQGTFTIEQTQVDKEKGIPVFKLSTDLSWTIDGVEHRLPITLSQAKQTFSVAMSAEPQQARFDPDSKALHKLSFNPGDPMLRRQLTAAPDVIGRIQAAYELAKTSKRRNIEAIVAAYPNELFWGVRCEFVKALGESNTEMAVAGLAEIISTEHEPLVLATLFQAAGHYRDPRIGQALTNRLQGELPYVARQAAYETLGKQRDKAPWDILVEAAQQESFNGVVQSGAFRGLAATRRAEAVDLLLKRVPYGATTNRSRPAAVSALADIGQSQEKGPREHIVETLIDLLRDPWPQAAHAAARGLQTIKASEAIAALESYSRSVSHMERVVIERIITTLRQSDKIDGSALKKHVEQLQEQVRNLEDQLQKLEAKVTPDEAAPVDPKIG